MASLRHPLSCNTIVTNLEVQDTDFLDTSVCSSLGFSAEVNVQVIERNSAVKMAMRRCLGDVIDVEAVVSVVMLVQAPQSD